MTNKIKKTIHCDKTKCDLKIKKCMKVNKNDTSKCGYYSYDLSKK